MLNFDTFDGSCKAYGKTPDIWLESFLDYCMFKYCSHFMVTPYLHWLLHYQNIIVHSMIKRLKPAQARL